MHADQPNIKGNWLLLCQLAVSNPSAFLSRWNQLSAQERATLREDVRVMWCRQFENRPMFNTFLRMTEA